MPSFASAESRFGNAAKILLDVDSTDDPTYGQQQLSFFNGAYNQHMYHPLLIFERHTGCLLAARLRRGTASSHARIVPLLLRILRRLLLEFPGVTWPFQSLFQTVARLGDTS